jgi:hypothetical protein
MYLFPRRLRMLIDAILVSTNTRTHTPSLSLSLRCLASPSSTYKALHRRNHDQSKYRFLRIRFSHFKGCTYIKLAYYLDMLITLVKSFVVHTPGVLSSP